jgi:hypothetical protein
MEEGKFLKLKKKRKHANGETELTSKMSWALWVALAVEVVCCC